MSLIETLWPKSPPSLLASVFAQAATALLATAEPETDVAASADYAAWQARYRHDPLGFARDCLYWPAGGGPTPYQAEIFDKVVERGRICVRGPHGLGKCLCYNAAMRLADGRIVEAQDLIGKTFQVLAVDKDLGIHAADALAWDNGVRDVVEIVTDKGRVLTRTLNHPLWADPSPYHWDMAVYANRIRPVGAWVAAGDLQPGATVAVYLGNAGAESASHTDAEIKLAAYLIADGGLTSGGIRFAQAPGDVLNEFSEVCASFGVPVRWAGKGYDYHARIADDKVQRVNGLKQNPIVNMAKAWGLYKKNSHQKRFPAWVWQLDDRCLSLFMSRLFSCDGWAHSAKRHDGRTNREIGYATVNPDLAADVSRALLRLGIHAETRQKRTTWTHKGERKAGQAWTVAVHDAAQILRFAEQVGIFGKEDQVARVVATCKQASLKEQQKWRKHGLPEQYAWERVKSVRIIENQPTVAITVPGYETFLTEFVEHNTALAAQLILWFALTRDGADWKVVTTASAWRQVEKYLWPEVHKWARLVKWDEVGRAPFSGNEMLQLTLKLSTGAAFAVVSDNPALIEGAHADHIMYVFDESKAIPDATFDAAEGALTGAGGGEAYAVAISTPGDPVGRFYDIQKRKPGFEDWWVRHVTRGECIAAGRMTEAWAEQRKAQWGDTSAVYQNRVEGEFASADEDGVIPLSWIEKANERWQDLNGRIGRREAEWGPLTCLGVDVARYGEDKTVFALRCGQAIKELRTFAKADTMETAGRVAMLLKAHGGAGAMIDIVGVGAGVLDRVREQGLLTEGFGAGERTNFRDRSGELQFADCRAAAWWNLRELLDPTNGEGIALPPDDKLLGDLSAPKWRAMSGGRIRVESKNDIRKRLGRSTDHADAVAQAFWWGVENGPPLLIDNPW